jgi:glycosyltransferase involved in cell wall biosynthesis
MGGARVILLAGALDQRLSPVDPGVQSQMLSILMPVYNERERVARAIAEVLQTELPSELELIIVDDGSTDGTREILRNGSWDPRVRLFEHEHNQGKGAAVQTALGHAQGEFSAIFDADLEYDPADLGLLMPPLLDGRSNACFGVRAFDGYTSHSFLFVLGNKGVTLACNVLFNVYLHDIMTCQKMIRTDLFRSLQLSSAGFAIEPEITARLVQHGEPIFEVPVHYRARSNEQGKKLTALDGFRVIATLLRCRFSGV